MRLPRLGPTADPDIYREFVELQKQIDRQPKYMDAAPTEGTWGIGSIVFSTNPVANDYIGWVCTTGGSPGTWKQWGKILP